MNVFDLPTPGAPYQQLAAELREIRKYLVDPADPNETAGDGRTLLLLALGLCVDSEGEALAMRLLERGADPNKPTPCAIFTKLLTASNSLPLVTKLVECGLRLNDVYDLSRAQGWLTDGPSTLLDHAYAIRDSISPKRKNLDALANKYAGGLGGRRRFIDETIALLELHGAKRASDLERS